MAEKKRFYKAFWHVLTKRALHHKNLQVRFLLSYLQLILIIVVVFSFFFFQYTSSVLINRETANIVSLASFLQVQTDQAIQAMDNVSINIGYSNLVMTNLEDFFASQVRDRDETNRLADLFVAMNGADVQVEQINVYNFSGEVVGFGKTNVQTKINLEEQDWYVDTIARQGFKFLSQPYIADTLSRTSKSSTYYLSLYRTYRNRFGKEVGIIETVQACSTVFKSLISIERANANAPALYVFDENQQPVYPFNLDSQADMSIPAYYLNQISTAEDSILLRNPESKAKELVAFMRSSYSGWTYMIVQPERIILAPVYRMVMILVGVVVLLLLAATLLSLSMSLRLSRPIRELHDIICTTELETLGDIPQQPLKDGFSEVEELNTAFHTMSNKLKKSKDDMILAQQQEMKARSVALQAQINPHFYYNSLANIIVLAKKGMNDSIIQLCQNLTGIMRYVTNTKISQVTIAEEITYLKQYLFCMKVRYQDSLGYDIEIDPAIEQELIPKLMIQPLVENALKYGTNCPPPWKIQVKGYRDDNGWIIEVLDQGPGFSETSLEAFLDQKSWIDQHQEMPDAELGGMGLANVYARWRLFAGATGTFMLSNREEGGARIRIGRTVEAQST